MNGTPPASRKRPYFIHRRDGALFGIAGLAETWIGPNGEELDTVAIVTAAASADLAVLHHRVPVTIAPGDFERWLDCSDDSADSVMALLIAPGEGEFAWHEVSTRVNRVANDDAQLILPITDGAARGGGAEAAKKASPRKPEAAALRMTGRGVCFDLVPLVSSRSALRSVHQIRANAEQIALQLHHRAIWRRQHRPAGRLGDQRGHRRQAVLRERNQVAVAQIA